jgi:hypothetical protein
MCFSPKKYLQDSGVDSRGSSSGASTASSIVLNF